MFRLIEEFLSNFWKLFWKTKPECYNYISKFLAILLTGIVKLDSNNKQACLCGVKGEPIYVNNKSLLESLCEPRAKARHRCTISRLRKLFLSYKEPSIGIGILCLQI